MNKDRLSTLDMSVSGVQAAYAANAFTPTQLFAALLDRANDFDDHNIWIHRLSLEELEPYLSKLQTLSPASSPLWGVPFAVKDNIDLVGVDTTAGCEAFAYPAQQNAFVVQQLIDAGAIPIGKTNLDQFATGLNGTRSPYGACKNSFNAEYISGGSSSGSAVAVALGLASFSLGSDTAGSGRVPACFNNLIGVKPSLGLLSSSGMVPACRSLDTISIFTLNADDANTVLGVAEGYDATDGYSRDNPFANQSRHYGLHQDSLTLGVIARDQLEFFGDADYAAAYQATLAKLTEGGFQFKELDYAPFKEAANLLYEGPWVSERYLATQPLIDQQPEALFPVVKDIIIGGRTPKATELFKAQYALKQLRTRCLAQLAGLDGLLTPSAPRLFTIGEMLQEPILRNSQLGQYTNFMNLLDMSAVAVPTAFTDKALPFGVTLSADRFNDRRLLSIANRIQQLIAMPVGALAKKNAELTKQPYINTETVDVLVCGAHLSGLPLNWQLVERGGTLKERTQSAAAYQLFALSDGLRPAMIRNEERGTSIEVEIWSLPAKEFGSFVAGIPAPLGIGKVEVADGRWVSGFICEKSGIADARDISEHGGWRAWLEQRTTAQ